MSETSEVVEKPPGELDPAEESACERNDGQSVDTIVISKKDSEVSMIEDEEMPTFSSISSSTKPNNSVATHEQKMDDVPSEKDRTPSPEPSDDQDNESIYVVSSSADTDRNPDDIEEEDEDDYDSEDMNEDDDEDEDDDDVRDDYNRDPYDRDSDEFEADRFERASDDFVLRHSNRIKIKYHKERSQSLQDLAVVKARNHKRRSSGFAWERSGFRKNPFSYQSPQPRPYQGSGRYEHVESKVKRYIQDIKEQNKVSKYEEYMKGKNAGCVEPKDSNENKRKSSIGGKNIKDYAEKVIKELEREERPYDQNPIYATLERIENGEEPITLRLSTDRISSDSNMLMEVDSSPPGKQNHEDKLERANGIIEFSEESSVTCTPIIKGISLSRLNEHVNGAEASTNLLNMRSLSYEEYMRGSAQEEIEVESNEICLISPEKPSHNLKNNTNFIQITNVRSNHEVSEEYESDEVYEENLEIHQSPEKSKTESRELTILRASLNQRNAQFDCLQVAYQNTLEENIAMKQELEHLKKALKEHEKNQNREKKSAAIQTEKPVDPQMNTLTVGKGDNKMSISSITSAVSSIHQWSESACSPGISIPSPDVRKVLNSDDSSAFENTPKKPSRTFSRAFITSSRILQTLSNITQGKTCINDPLVQGLKDSEAQDDQDQIKTPQDPSTSGTPLNSKKRKATEMLGAPHFEQPFKIPHTSGAGKKKLSQNSSNETSKMNGLPSETEDYTENGEDGECQEGDIKKADLGDGLKYFIYKDDESSKDRSFLIQAEDPGKVPTKGIVRECGPYLLGNLEVRMTEVNGTINIWGKEINLESSGEEFEISAKSSELKSGLCWQKTPRSNLLNNIPLVSSTNKMSNPQPRFSDFNNTSKFSPSSGNSIPKYSPQANERSCRRRSSLTTDDNCNSRSHRLSWSGCKHLMEEQKHACCSHSPEVNCERCGCNYNVRRHNCHSCNRVQSCAGDFRRHSFSGGCHDNSARQCSSYGLKSGNDMTCRYQTAYCRNFPDEEESCQHFSKQCHLPREFAHSCNPKSVAMQTECRESCAGNCCPNRSSSTQDEDDPLIPSQQPNEPPEVRKRRLSGKRVRSLLMDLLKGCGDCRTSNPANISKSSLRSQESRYMHTTCPPEIIVSPCSPRASCSDQSKSMEKNRCCDTCSHRIEMTAEIETQLEFFRVEMERLRSRSDALLDKFNMLKSTDVN